ncbi:DEAD/DEAH box helicase [Pseudemcibacter aquimaris]|uniref:DEAD/DEAH box helicase n=1 Tax=Pseudemcibacter aquimaris TaxID=2857064 RepID=UPI00201196D4|nr:DEAD/DEAH box helicase [Pseudemcibacter aquimaris]MCC3862659.1 DEAD/DEAH box helicase [Pseudemcibacter aquimaris]WDU57831.1 DEAD/DEAH box helicase [Pseudemcibacter aquimaris]
MILRPRQKTFVERCTAALHEHGNTLGVAPTGAGKTIMLSGVAGGYVADSDAKVCVLAHRDELTGQNEAKFKRVNRGARTSRFDATNKDWSGQTTFAMVQTLSRQANVKAMPKLDLLVIDEAHHAAADSYRRVIDQAYDQNPDLKLFGVTATPNRGDKQGLRPVFSNVGDQIAIGELIASGHLVPPRTFVIDVGAQKELTQVRKSVDDFDMAQVDAIMNRSPITDAVIKHWQDKAHDRPTVVFCSTISHAQNVSDAFNAHGVAAAAIHGELSSKSRAAILKAYGDGDIQVVVNVAVLTEGWDHPPTSCVILLRPSSYKSTMIQMVGRGLRTVDPEEFPGVVKTDCIVLDFGTSSLLHGSLEQDVDLDLRTGDGEAPQKECPECHAMVPISSRECSICSHVFETETTEGTPLSDFIMSEVDLLKRSSFRWVDLFGDDLALMACGFKAWAGIFYLGGRWYAVGGVDGKIVRLLSVGERTICLASADDWLNDYESDETAHKTKGWLNQSATAKQLALLPADYRMDFSLTRYQASALLKFQFNRGSIQQLVMRSAEDLAA